MKLGFRPKFRVSVVWTTLSLMLALTLTSSTAIASGSSTSSSNPATETKRAPARLGDDDDQGMHVAGLHRTGDDDDDGVNIRSCSLRGDDDDDGANVFQIIYICPARAEFRWPLTRQLFGTPWP